jgi:hypothetical protein
MILIISADNDFAVVIAEQVKNELKLECRTAQAIDEAKDFLPAVTAIVTDGIVERAPVPVVSLAGRVPVRLRAVLAELGEALRKSTDAQVRIGKLLEFSPRQKHIAHLPDGATAELTDKEAHLLQYVIESGRQGVTRERLLKEVWGVESDLNTHTLETHIYRLRAKLRELSGGDIIEAFEGGYRIK